MAHLEREIRYWRDDGVGTHDTAPFTFGAPGGSFLPVAGDWNNDGVDTIGLYNTQSGFVFLTNTNASGNGDVTFVFTAGP